MKSLHTLFTLSALTLTASAALVIDGTRDEDYGSALAVQTVQTGFGDNASEWNAGYAKIESGRLYLMFTGNLEANLNKLEIFIDSKLGGQSIFDSSGNDNAGRMDGLRFDTGFTADYHLIARRGGDNFDLDFANLVAQSASGYFDIMGGNQGFGTTGTGVNGSPIDVAYNNSNTAGVGGNNGSAADPVAAAAVTTGIEISIALGDLGYVDGTDIRVMVGQNGSGHDYFSNQFLGGLPVNTGNLGGDGNGAFTGTAAIDFQNFAGDQFFTVPAPEPATGILLLGSTLFLASRRRRH